MTNLEIMLYAFILIAVMGAATIGIAAMGARRS
jgi:hypothetical protein